jgi:hypothetical protein
MDPSYHKVNTLPERESGKNVDLAVILQNGNSNP